MTTPYDSKEFQETLKWRSEAENKALVVSNCISSWTDICGFGSLLEQAKWDLDKLQKEGIVRLLNEFHFIAGRPLLVNIDPFPNDKVIVLNDGIARTIDLFYSETLHAHIFLLYFRDLLFTHYHLLRFTKSFKIGVRTILAGGQRVQYSPASTTGHLSLYYDEQNPSDFGKKLLSTTFVYNPAEFQMNTAFAKAFTIDSLGTKNNIRVNGLYIESDYFKKLDKIVGLQIDLHEKTIILSRENIPMFELSISNTELKNLKGIETIIYQIDNFHIFKEFDGDELDFEMFNQNE
jgi:hypothetical protein